ncbi:hypothetical protein PIB30_011625 [Stylosanthes scabra]|uniref:Uncharacterized protein n=1 Tax=Stylosanthes scabra TaxID=79078 RepID=A0ABU6V6R0_9FABA|nr:hypothetical protein [Stylosanthes scabra]
MVNTFPLNACNMKATICLFFLAATTFMIAGSARILDEVNPQQPQVSGNGNGNLPLPAAANGNPAVTTQQLGAATTLLSSQTSAAANTDPPLPDKALTGGPQLPPTRSSPSNSPSTPPVAVGGANGNGLLKAPSLSFFMRDILGGHMDPSARVVAGIVANTDVTGLPYHHQQQPPTPCRPQWGTVKHIVECVWF